MALFHGIALHCLGHGSRGEQPRESKNGSGKKFQKESDRQAQEHPSSMAEPKCWVQVLPVPFFHLFLILEDLHSER